VAWDGGGVKVGRTVQKVRELTHFDVDKKDPYSEGALRKIRPNELRGTSGWLRVF